MSSQFPSFRLTVAERMQPKAVRERVGRRIEAARLHEGMDRRDLAYALKVAEKTVERWETGERYPQLRHRKTLADRLEQLTIDELNPDLEAEERAVLDQLDRIEDKLDWLIEQQATEKRQSQKAVDEIAAAGKRSQARRQPPAQDPPAPRKKAQGS